jgi:RHS repeat-associated protein
MPMTECFYTMNGQMMAYDSGGVTKDFLTDHLGSIIAEVDQDENVTYQARYSAFGKPTSSTGTGCGFGWIGSYGYRETGLPHMSHYVRARHYSQVTGNWSTVDPLWPGESAYGYVGGRASAVFDASGLQGQGIIGKYEWDPRPRNCHTGNLVNHNFNKRSCFGGTFSLCMCNAAKAGQDAVNGKTDGTKKGNAIDHCTLACTIMASCGPSGSTEWDSREECPTNPICCIPLSDCGRDSGNNNIGFGFGRGLPRNLKSKESIAQMCYSKCKSAGFPPLR